MQEINGIWDHILRNAETSLLEVFSQKALMFAFFPILTRPDINVFQQHHIKITLKELVF